MHPIAALEQGSPIVEYDTQLQNGNLLTNPGFEQGLTGWTTNAGAAAGMAPSGPTAYDGSELFLRRQRCHHRRMRSSRSTCCTRATA